MPIYLYKCARGHVTETVHHMGEIISVACSTCGYETRRMFVVANVKKSSFIEPSPAIKQFLGTTSERRDQYEAKKAARGK
jgi:uncharacterized Fe-S cluster-containing protein